MHASFSSFRRAQEHLYTITEGSVVGSQVEYIITFLHDRPYIKDILEIGFNGGLSSAAMLSARPDIRVTSFDLGSHPYVPLAKDLIDKTFGESRHRLVLGDSTETLPEFAKTTRTRFDFAFVDGGHVDPVPRLDILNAVNLGKKGAFVFVDDYCSVYGSEGVIAAYDDAVSSGIIETVYGPFEGEGHRGWIVGQIASVDP